MSYRTNNRGGGYGGRSRNSGKFKGSPRSHKAAQEKIEANLIKADGVLQDTYNLMVEDCPKSVPHLETAKKQVGKARLATTEAYLEVNKAFKK